MKFWKEAQVSRSVYTVALLSLLPASQVLAEPTHSIIEIGLTDSEHTSLFSHQSSWVFDMNDTGQVAGYSARYDSHGAYMGQSAWLYSNGTTNKIGLTGIDYKNSWGHQYTHISGLNESGYVWGTNDFYDVAATDASGGHSWVYHNGQTTRVGVISDARLSVITDYNESGLFVGYDEVIDAQNRYVKKAWLHLSGESTEIGVTGALDNSVYGVNEAGHIAGVSDGSAWLYSNGDPQNIGLMDDQHTNLWDGGQSSEILALNESGEVLGRALRVHNVSETHKGTVNGYSVWLHGQNGSRNIGLTDIEHTQYMPASTYDDPNGFREERNSRATLLNEAGQVAGTSTRYGDGDERGYYGANMGETAWFYSNGQHTRLGFTDAAHTRNDGYRGSYVSHLNEFGEVAGSSIRYATDGTSLGNTAWVDYGAGVVDVVGLVDAEHTRNDGRRITNVKHLNNEGQSAGVSERYAADGSSLGNSAWFHDDASVRIDPTDTVHSLSAIDVLELTDTGLVSGSASIGNGTLGSLAWLYDSTIDQTFTFDFDVRADGYSFSKISALFDDGAVGTYDIFDHYGERVGSRAFAYQIGGIFYDLDDAYWETLDAAGWESFALIASINDLGMVTGSGYKPGYDSQQAFLAVPNVSTVPVPAAFWLFGSGLIGLVATARRKKS